MLTQSICMKVLILIFFIIQLLICIITYPFKMKGAIHINVLENIGFAVIKVFNIRLFSGRFKMSQDGHLSMEKEKKNKKKKKNKTLLQHYFISLAKKVDVKKAELFFNGGREDDACFVSLVSGYINVLMSSLFAVLMNKYKTMKTFLSVEPDYNKNRMEITATGVISFCLLDMFLSVVHAFISYLKEKEIEKNV